MYSQEDKNVMRRRLWKYCIIAAFGALICIAGFVVGVHANVRSVVLAMGSAAALFVYVCFMWLMYIYPCAKYAGYLKDMDAGLTKEMDCTILSIDEKEETQDGVRVYPVHVFLEDEQDERILYIDVSKLDQMPKQDAKVHLGCFGRHIKEARAF